MSRQPRKVIVQESTGRRLIEQSRVRLLCVGLFFSLCFISICLRMVEVAVFQAPKKATVTVSDPDDAAPGEEVMLGAPEQALSRGDVVDRNGVLLATSLMTASVFVNPKEIRNPEEAAAKLAGVLAMDSKLLLARLKSDKTFVWIKRNITPRTQQAVNSLGIPGLYFSPEERRVYPYGNLLAHTVGYVGIDNKGLSGIEQQFDRRLKDTAVNRDPLPLSLDIRLQAILHEEMEKAIDQFKAIGGAGVIMDIESGELLSLVSLPDFDPHRPGKAADTARFNRVALGTYEMGSTFKSFTMAMALDYGAATMQGGYDATNPLKISTFTIQDTHPQKRWLTIPEIYAYSSNIGAAKAALDVGIKKQKAFLEKIGMLQPVDVELPEKASPLYPSDWKEINAVTISYGHGISVSPLHLVRGIAALASGTMPKLTLIKDGNKNRPAGEQVISEQTAKNMRRLMRLVVEHGTATKADVPGYRVGGKTGTAEKVGARGGYNDNAKLASFVSVFPVDAPRYAILVMIDEPKGDKSTFGYATGGWIAAPVVGQVISRLGPMLSMKPQFDTPEDDAEKFWVNRKPAPAPAPVAVKAALHEASY